MIDGENGRLDFDQKQVDNRWNGDGKLKPTCELKPTSLPKDALKVEFNCEIENEAFKGLLAKEGKQAKRSGTLFDKIKEIDRKQEKPLMKRLQSQTVSLAQKQKTSAITARKEKEI